MTNNFSMEFLHKGETMLRKHLRRKNQGLRSQTIFLIDKFFKTKNSTKATLFGFRNKNCLSSRGKKASVFSHNTCLSQL